MSKKQAVHLSIFEALLSWFSQDAHHMEELSQLEDARGIPLNFCARPSSTRCPSTASRAGLEPIRSSFIQNLFRIDSYSLTHESKLPTTFQSGPGALPLYLLVQEIRSAEYGHRRRTSRPDVSCGWGGWTAPCGTGTDCAEPRTCR